MSDIHQFIASLDLPDVESNQRMQRSAMAVAASEPRPGLAVDPDKPQGYVDAGSTISFVAGVSPESQDDVLNSTLLAQLAANKKYDREKDTQNWYRFYTDTLGQVGWVIQNFSFMKYQASGSSFLVDKVVLGILGAIASGNEIAIVQQTLNALKSLSNNDNRLVLFDTQSSSQSAGNFQISTANETDGQVAMKLGAFYFSTSQSTTRFLWATFSNSNSSIYQGAQTVTLNGSAYSKVRQQIIDKLGDRARQFVANLDI